MSADPRAALAADQVLPLEGLLVVGLEQAVSAPHCTRQLADLGARVIKIESPTGDFCRYYDDAVGEVSAYFAWANRGKESVVLDLKSPDDRAVLERILAAADVLVQNLAPGAAERLGVDAAGATGRHPRLIAVDISGYGTGGERERSRAYDLLVQSEGGSCAITGTAGNPAKPGVPFVDVGTGMTAATAILAAVIDRGRTGRGTAITIGMFDVVTDWVSWALHQAAATGTDPVPVGMASPLVAPYGAYRTADDQTIVLGTTSDAEWRRLCNDLLGMPELVADPRYAMNADRVARRAELDEHVGAWAASCTFAEASAAAEAAGIGWGRYNTPTEVLHHSELERRGRWATTAAPGRTFRSLRPAADSDSWSWQAGAVPALGEHTDAVRAEFADVASGN
ncbi:MAG: CoA transferase [Frankiaceae bacterium]|nr:CoA transferase [Frankiaceae bacterium]MBV9872480.1 CoA transferase [Frankiaceae bacterium]